MRVNAVTQTTGDVAGEAFQLGFGASAESGCATQCRSDEFELNIERLLMQNKAVGDLARKMLLDMQGSKAGGPSDPEFDLAEEMSANNYDHMMFSLSSLALDASGSLNHKPQAAWGARGTGHGGDSGQSEKGRASMSASYTSDDEPTSIDPMDDLDPDGLPVGPASPSYYGKECPICQKTYTRSCTLMVLPCNHAYHFNCVSRWFNSHRTCPLCRDDVTNSRAAGSASGSADSVLALRVLSRSATHDGAQRGRAPPALRPSTNGESARAQSASARAQSASVRAQSASVPVTASLSVPAPPPPCESEEGLSTSPKHIMFSRMIPSARRRSLDDLPPVLRAATLTDPCPAYCADAVGFKQELPLPLSPAPGVADVSSVRASTTPFGAFEPHAADVFKPVARAPPAESGLLAAPSPRSAFRPPGRAGPFRPVARRAAPAMMPAHANGTS